MAGTDILQAITVSPQVLVSQQLTAIDAVVYSAATSTSVKIQQGVLCNVTIGTIYVNLSILKSGQAIDSTHRVIHNYPLAGGDTLDLSPYFANLVLGPGDFIAGFASAASSVNVIFTGLVHA